MIKDDYDTNEEVGSDVSEDAIEAVYGRFPDEFSNDGFTGQLAHDGIAGRIAPDRIDGKVAHDGITGKVARDGRTGEEVPNERPSKETAASKGAASKGAASKEATSKETISKEASSETTSEASSETISETTTETTTEATSEATSEASCEKNSVPSKTLRSSVKTDGSGVSVVCYDELKLLTSILEAEVAIISVFPEVKSYECKWPIMCAIQRYGILERHPWLLHDDLSGVPQMFSCKLAEVIQSKKMRGKQPEKYRTFIELYGYLQNNLEVTIRNANSAYIVPPAYTESMSVVSYVEKVKNYFIYGLKVDIDAPILEPLKIIALWLLRPGVEKFIWIRCNRNMVDIFGVNSLSELFTSVHELALS